MNIAERIQFIGVCVYRERDLVSVVKGKGISITVKPRTFHMKLWQNRLIAVSAFAGPRSYAALTSIPFVITVVH
jgi:hypothetical protein